MNKCTVERAIEGTGWINHVLAHVVGVCPLDGNCPVDVMEQIRILLHEVCSMQDEHERVELGPWVFSFEWNEIGYAEVKVGGFGKEAILFHMY